MKTRLIMLLPLLLSACEGEPPKMAPTVAVGPPEPETTAELTAHADTTAPATPPQNAPMACVNACPCGCGSAGAADGGAPPAVVTATPPTAPALSIIHGTVTTTPKVSAASAVIYLEDAPLLPTTKMSATIDNRTMTFSPFVSVVPVGGKVTFRNDDPFPHNVFSPDSGGFNIGMVAQHASSTRIFKKETSYALLCNLHPGMLGYLVVVPSGYFAKSDAHGAYALKDVPPGTYKITAWAPRTQPVTQSVVVKDGEISLDFELHR
jgi:plastocyanin